MSTWFKFSAPEDTTSRLQTLSDGNLLFFLRQLPWIFIQSAINSSDDFASVDLCRRILHALPREFVDYFNEVNEVTNAEEIISVMQSADMSVATKRVITTAPTSWLDIA